MVVASTGFSKSLVAAAAVVVVMSADAAAGVYGCCCCSGYWFLPYFPYLFTIQLTFSPYFPYHFTFFRIFHIISHFPYRLFLKLCTEGMFFLNLYG
jgi:hypothetical protein